MKKLAVLLTLVLFPTTLQASPIFGEGDFPELDALMARHAKQFYAINAYPFGLSLDAHVASEVARAQIDQFCADDGSADVAEALGTHVFELLAAYGEYGDLGFFGGVAVVGTAYAYLTLKKEGASETELAVARARVVRAARSWHVFKVVTGGDGLVARGIMRRVPEDSDDPPIPNVSPEYIPLFDEDGAPLPEPKSNGSHRADNSDGALPDGIWSWVDSCSKDQLVGQVFAMVALYDAMKDDPDIDQALVEELADDARLIADMLMTKRDISLLDGAGGMGEYDLIIMDADGRPTMYHDLNPASIEKFYVPEGAASFNVFNLFMSIGIFKGLHHVSGDPAIEAFLYEEMLAARGYLDLAANTESPDAVDYVYMGTRTNFDAPDMTAVALFLALYLETDEQVDGILRTFMEERWWDRADERHTARLCKQPLWHAIYLAVTDRGSDPGLVAELADLLSGFSLGPYWNDARINCDEDELAAGECLAIDGETILVIGGENERGGAMATEALHPSIRPPSNFDARSNPFAVNGGGGLRLNPGGDLLAAYWLARYMETLAPGETHRSPYARAHMPVGGWPDDPVEPGAEIASTDVAGPLPDYISSAPEETVATSDSEGAVDAGVAVQAAGGGGDCSTAANARVSPTWLLLLLLLGGVARLLRRTAPSARSGAPSA